MDIEKLRSHCLSKMEVTEGFPFDEDTLVFKVAGKLFALTNLKSAESVNLKCEPEKAIELRAQFPDQVLPGWHMNKKHWNTVRFDGHMPDEDFIDLVDHSYDRVVMGMKKADRERLGK